MDVAKVGRGRVEHGWMGSSISDNESQKFQLTAHYRIFNKARE